MMMLTRLAGAVLLIPTTTADAVPQRQSREASFESVIVCQEGVLDPGAFQDCIFTAEEDRPYTFVWSSQTVDFDVIKLGVEPMSSVYIGNRFGMYFTDCCTDAAGENMPCEWLDSNVVRYRGSCSSGDVSPIPGGDPPAPAPPEPEPEPEYATETDDNIQEAAYSGIVVRVFLREGQSVLMISEDQGLMSSRNASAYAPLGSEDSESLAARTSRAIVGREEKAIVCGREGPNPRDCTFTAGSGAPGEEDTVYSFLFSASATSGPFDIIKLGIDPLQEVHIGNRIGMVFIDCCAAEPGEPDTSVCSFVDPPLVRYEGTCTATSAVEPIGFIPPEPEPAPPPPAITCCALEPVGACQRECECAPAPGDEPIVAYCRGPPSDPLLAGTATALDTSGSKSSYTKLTAAMVEQHHHRRQLGESVYTSLVVQLVMSEGQRVTILPRGDGLM